ncbi:hypothetical protein BGW36DRAFT_294379 [Talaromyces proteolyticus]|uniref:Uncharacterized protein n=1 Tax=Talaromyces proteolyticus TaxID=1131652 RepID=A0AAD4PWL9_9EURO|nr:uncharacterized protein BGW36DRAFT_294379 [Talaromyces proteolyticus]KAH8698262.1 hypothetical protein BGW36DRAFT_294379 [Talaromyces proteolyticus]
MNSNSTGPSSFSGPITTAAASAQSNPRRMSITTLGLSGSPTQTSPFSNLPPRRESLSSSGSFEEAVDDNESASPNHPTSPFARRASFGAQALREARGGTGTGNDNSPAHSASTSKNTSANERSNLSWRPTGEGFNWSAALRNRAERAPSIGGSNQQSPINSDPQIHHQRAASIAIMEQPSRELPKEPRQNKPDFFQEKILRADFMD